ncbi:hypothetical protein SASPL_105210 [Salvia splendens]|uniref:VIN3-like C-terminal domain-containing protein n=1 Tax=Salvia splendens TaxID=180675 RepID=A0A8X8YP72_SALSN|nr:hypothetical protein SASPL_105210 [Salvia splendens]
MKVALERELGPISEAAVKFSHGSIPNSVHRYKNRVDVKSDSREKLVQKRRKEPQSGEKCMGVRGFEAETIQVRLPLLDLNEEFQGGHVSMEFRLNFLTWFSLKAREHERRVVRTFMKTMIDDPSGLAGQLVQAIDTGKLGSPDSVACIFVPQPKAIVTKSLGLRLKTNYVVDVNDNMPPFGFT